MTRRRRAHWPRVEEALDLDDRRRRVAHLAEELEAHRADRRRHPVQDEARADDDAVAAFLLHAGQAREELVGDVLAEARLAELRRRESSSVSRRATRRRRRRRASAARTSPARRRGSCRGCGRCASPRATRASGVTMRHDARLSSAVPHSTAFLPPAFIATLPPMHDASADVGSHANTRPVRFGGIHRALRDDAGAAVDRRRRARVCPGSTIALDRRQPLELLGVDHRRARDRAESRRRCSRCRRRAE